MMERIGRAIFAALRFVAHGSKYRHSAFVSPHRHLPVHQHRQQPVARWDRFKKIQKNSCLRLPHDSIVRLLQNWVVSLHGILSNLVTKKNTGFCYGWRSFIWLLLPMALQVFFCAHNSASHRFSPICGSSWLRFARSYFGLDQNARKHARGCSLTLPD